MARRHCPDVPPRTGADGRRHGSDLDLLRLYRADVSAIVEPLDDAETRALVRRAQAPEDSAGSGEFAALAADRQWARDRLVLALLPTVLQVADRMTRQGRVAGVDRLDLVQTGNEALFGAIDTYDTGSGWALANHAARVVWTAMHRSTARDRAIRIPVPVLELLESVRRELDELPTEAETWSLEERASAIGRTPADIRAYLELRRIPESLDQLLDGPHADAMLTVLPAEPPPTTAEESAQFHRLLVALECLPARWRAVVRMSTGLETGQPKTQAAIAEVLGVSRTRVGQILASAFESLRTLVEELPPHVCIAVPIAALGVPVSTPSGRSLVEEYLDRHVAGVEPARSRLSGHPAQWSMLRKPVEAALSPARCASRIRSADVSGCAGRRGRATRR